MTSPAKTISLGPRELATTVMGEVLLTGKAVEMDVKACAEDPRCESGVDGVFLNNFACVPLFTKVHPDQSKVSSKTPTVVAVLLVGNAQTNALGSTASDEEETNIDMGLVQKICATVAPLVQAWVHESARVKSAEAMQICKKNLEEEVKSYMKMSTTACDEALAVAETSTDPETVFRAVRSACRGMLSIKSKDIDAVGVELIIVGEKEESLSDEEVAEESSQDLIKLIPQHRNLLGVELEESSLHVSVWKLGATPDSQRQNDAVEMLTHGNSMGSSVVEETLVGSSRILSVDRSGFPQALDQGFAILSEKGMKENDGKADADTTTVTHLYIKVDLEIQKQRADATDTNETPIQLIAGCVMKVSVPKVVTDLEARSVCGRLQSTCCKRA